MLLERFGVQDLRVRTMGSEFETLQVMNKRKPWCLHIDWTRRTSRLESLPSGLKQDETENAKYAYSHKLSTVVTDYQVFSRSEYFDNTFLNS
ncbi:hypothetical protein CDAR_227371 [Caerostris darwini]|uniref:Uncharacterized protein n=1 Tax=Caerostris darwini TaxID=1538125 RepID=A0AAV4UM08_9ARAC|nr:hypothetical protein CDAR_227371 [Caerostris darwini]